jgi:hypothetical protein
MRLNKNIFIIFLSSCVVVLFCCAQTKVEHKGNNGNGKGNFVLYWNDDGTLKKTVSTNELGSSERKYDKGTIVFINGKSYRKQPAIVDAYDKSINQTSLAYTLPFELVYGENYIDGKFHARTYFKNNSAYLLVVDSNYDGKIDGWVHYENGHIVMVESDRNYDGKIISKEYYRYNGKELVRIDVDSNSTGKIDRVKVKGKDF